MAKIINNNCKNEFNPGDRFIPSRAYQNYEYSNYILHDNAEDTSSMESFNDEMRFKNYGHYQLAKKRYQEQLWKLIAPKSRKILNFCKYPTNQKDNEMCHHIWPVIPRKRACIMSPIRILDLADVEMNTCYNLIDWSIRGEIAIVFKNEVHVWHPETRESTFVKFRDHVQHCVKFNIDASLIALAVTPCSVVITDVRTYKTFTHVHCCTERVKLCSVRCMEWLKDNILITGCTNGMLLCWDKHFRSAMGRHAHKGPIMAIRKSCFQQYLATSGMDGKLIVWRLATLESLYDVQFFSPVKAFDWHPWREPLLASSGGLANNILTLWNVTSMQQDTYRTYKDVIIDALTFNKLTGELVISCYDKTKKYNTIQVLASFTKIVDIMDSHIGRVPYLIWSGDNTQLLTAGADENLCIWDFFDAKSKKRFAKKKKMSLNSIENLTAFGQCIR